jgi:hypothetical protein
MYLRLKGLRAPAPPPILWLVLGSGEYFFGLNLENRDMIH